MLFSRAYKLGTCFEAGADFCYPIMRLNFWCKWRKAGRNPLLRIQKIKQFQGFAASLSTYRPRASRYRNVCDFRFPSYFECCVVKAPASRKVHTSPYFRNSGQFSPCDHNAGTADQRHVPKQAFSTHTGDNNVIKGLGLSQNRRVSGHRMCLLIHQIPVSTVPTPFFLSAEICAIL